MKKNDSIMRIKQFSDSEDDEEDVSMDEEESAEVENVEEIEKVIVKPKKITSKQKTRKKGIIYISSIPKHMNVSIAREMFEQFGDVGRMFLQPDSKGMTSKANKKKKNVTFTEGWIEFEKKKVAKWVVENINNTPISNKKGSKFHGILWSLKYLPRFKWIHLSERLTYERAVHHQKLQIATSKARKEASFFQDNLDRSEKLNKKRPRKTNE